MWCGTRVIAAALGEQINPTFFSHFFFNLLFLLSYSRSRGRALLHARFLHLPEDFQAKFRPRETRNNFKRRSDNFVFILLKFSREIAINCERSLRSRETHQVDSSGRKVAFDRISLPSQRGFLPHLDDWISNLTKHPVFDLEVLRICLVRVDGWSSMLEQDYGAHSVAPFEGGETRIYALSLCCARRR